MATRTPIATLARHLHCASSKQRSQFYPIPVLTSRIPRRAPLSQRHTNQHPHSRTFITTSSIHLEAPPIQKTPQSPKEIKSYTFEDIKSLIATTSSKTKTVLLVDVREPSELSSTGYIPSAINLPLKSQPEFMFLSAQEFEDRFGFPRPDGEVEVVFYCRSGVRSKAAARLALEGGFGGRVAEYSGSWMDWEKHGGRVERSGESGGGAGS